MIFFEILFWFCILALLHSYFFFPLILQLLSFKKREPRHVYRRVDDLPVVSIVMAAYNEEQVIEEKIKSILSNDYPEDKVEILIGSDASTDQTNEIIRSFQKLHTNITFKYYPDRTGKPTIINQLVENATGEILLLTDANVLFGTSTIFELVKHFNDASIGLVDGNMINHRNEEEGISVQEGSYINREIKIKYLQGQLWGTMMGPFGGCYAIRTSYYTNVPSTFTVDDFYINMQVLRKGALAINELNAKCFEDVSNEMEEEFRRKIRISAGNFQNLSYFARMLFSSVKGLSFCFWSHKVIRWCGPFLLILLYLCSGLLSEAHNFYEYVFIVQSVLLLTPVLDYLLKQINIHFRLLRFVTYFYLTNFALLIGFIKYLGGIRTNVWQPTKRTG